MTLAASAGGSGTGRSVVWHLSLYAAALIVPMMAFVGLLLWSMVSSEQERLREQVIAVARDVAADLDNDTLAVFAMLSTLGSSSALAEGDVEGVRRQAQALASVQQVGIAGRGADGGLLFQAGTLEAPETGALEEARRRVIETSAPAVSGLIQGGSQSPPGYAAVVPILRDGERPLLIEAFLPSERPLAILRRALPSSFWAASYVDRTGVLVTRTLNPEKMTGVSATPQFRQAATGAFGTWTGPSQEGRPLLGAFALSFATGWYVALGVEQDKLTEPLRRSVALGLLAMLGAIAISALSALHFGRRITSPIQGLAALSSGHGPIGAPAGDSLMLREVQIVAQALREANETLNQRNAELVESETHFRSFVELNPQLAWIADAAGHPLDISERWTSYTGMTREEAFTAGWAGAQHPDDLPGMVAAWRASLSSGEPLDIEHRLRRRDGTYRWMRTRAYPRRDASGAVIRWYGSTEDVEDRRRAREELRESQERLSLGLAVAGVGLADFDYGRDEVRLDARAAEIFGLPAGQSLARARLHERMQPDDRTRVLAEVGRLLGPDGSGFLQAEYRIIRADGAERWLVGRHQVDYATDADGVRRAVRGLLAMQDVTQAQRDKAAIAAAADQLRATAEAMPGLMWIITSDGVNSFVNKGYGDYAGRPAASLMGLGWRETIHPEDMAANLTLWREAVATRTTLAANYRFRRHDGEWRWHVVRTVPQKAADGQVVQWIGIATDIDELSRARQALEENRAALERRVAEATAERNEIWRLAPDMLGVGDLEGRWRSLNPAWTTVLGYGADEIMAMTPERMVHPEDMADAADMLSRLRDGEAVSSLAIRCRHRDGGWRRLSWTAVARDGLVYAVARDVTEQTLAQEQLRQAQEQLHQAQKTETIGHLTGGVAHDFNNLLAAVLSNLELARKRVAADPAATRLIDGAIQGAERGASLTARLLAFARRQELKASPVDIGVLLAGMRELLTRSLGPTMPLKTRVAPGLPLALVDPNQLELALLNLAVNARDAMPDGGEVRIEVDLETVPESAVMRGVEGPQAGDYVRITIVDTGMGMDEATLRRAAEPFFTTKGIGKGTGLGLPMVQGLMAQSGGAMRLGSEPGRGTRVTLLLPVAETAIAAAPAPQPAAAIAAPGALAILVVDDDPLVAMGAAAMIEDLGHRVHEANSAKEALKLLGDGLAVDLVMTDQAMPGMTGLELAREIAARWPRLPIILSTGYADLKPEERIDSLPRLAKPYRQSELEAVLAEAMRKTMGSDMNEDLARS